MSSNRKIADESSSSEDTSSEEEVKKTPVAEKKVDNKPAPKKESSSEEESSEESSDEEPVKKEPPKKETVASPAKKAAPAKKESSSEEESEESSDDQKDTKASPAAPKKKEESEDSSEEESEESSEEEKKPAQKPAEKKETASPVVEKKETPKKEETEEERKKKEQDAKLAEERRKKREELEKAATALKETKAGADLANKILTTDNLLAIDIVPALIDLIDKNLEDSDVVANSYLCIRHLEDATGFKSVFREKEGFPVLSKTLKSEKTEIKRSAVRFAGDTITKCGTAENIHNAEAFIAASAAPLIVALLSDKEGHIQSMCAGTIRVLSGFEGRSSVSYQEEFRKNGVCSPLMALLQSDSTDMIRQSAGAIRGLADGNKDNRDDFLAANVIAVLFKHLRAIPDPKVQIHLLSTVYTLTIASPKAAEEIVKADGLFYLKDELKADGNAEKHELVLGILKNICVDNNEMKHKIRDLGLLQLVIAIIKANVPEKEKESTTSSTTKGSTQQLTTKERVQKSACSCLAAVTAGNPENVKVATESEVLEVLIKYLYLDCEPVVSRALMAVKSLVTEHDSNLSLLSKKQVTARLIALLRSKNVDVRDTAVSVLVQCLRNDTLKKEMRRGAVDVLVEIQDPVPIPEALAILQSLLEDTNTRESFVTNKYNVMRVTSFLDDAGEKVIINTCSVLSTLSLNNTKGQNGIIKYDGANRLVKLLESTNPNILHHVAYTIWSVSKHNAKSQTAFNKSRALHSLNNLLKSDKANDVLREYALGAIYAIILDNWSNKKEFSKIKGVATIVPLLKSDVVKVRVNAAKAIWAATEGSSLLFGTLEDGQEQASAGVESLVRLIKTGKLAQQSAAASALYAISNKNPKNQKAIRDAGALELLVDMVKTYKQADHAKEPQKTEAMRWAVVAIGALATKNAENVAIFKKAGAVELIDPLRTFPNKNIQKESTSTLSALGAKTKPAPAPKEPKKKEEPKKEEPKKEEAKKEEPKKDGKKEEPEESDDESEEESEEEQKKPAQPGKKEEPKKNKEESESESEEESSEEEKKPAQPAAKAAAAQPKKPAESESEEESSASESVSSKEGKKAPANKKKPESSSSEESD